MIPVHVHAGPPSGGTFEDYDAFIVGWQPSTDGTVAYPIVWTDRGNATICKSTDKIRYSVTKR